MHEDCSSPQLLLQARVVQKEQHQVHHGEIVTLKSDAPPLNLAQNGSRGTLCSRALMNGHVLLAFHSISVLPRI